MPPEELDKYFANHKFITETIRESAIIQVL